MPRKRKNQPTKTEGDKRQRKETDEGNSIEILPMALQDKIEQPTAGTSTNQYVDFESIFWESGALDSRSFPATMCWRQCPKRVYIILGWGLMRCLRMSLTFWQKKFALINI